MKFSHKHEIDAIQFNGRNFSEVKSWAAEVSGCDPGELPMIYMDYPQPRNGIKIMLPGGDEFARSGDWICIDHHGRFFVKKEAEFDDEFEKAIVGEVG